MADAKAGHIMQQHTCDAPSLLGNDDLAILVVTAVGAHVMRKLHGAATGAGGTRGGIDLHIGGTTVMRTDASLLFLRYWHVDLPYYFTLRHCLRASSDNSILAAQMYSDYLD